MIKKILWILPALALALSLAACQSPSEKAGEKAAENLAEKMLEKASGGKADVDIKGDSVEVKTDEGSIQTGEKVSLPAEFPKDVYVYEGDIKAVFTNAENKGYTVSIETSKTPAEIKTAYEARLKSDGWKTTGTMDFGDSISIGAEKDTRTVSVIIGKDDEVSTIVLGTGEKLIK